VTTTVAVAVTVAHPPAAGIVYVTVYVPGVLVLGVISPVVELIDNPDAELKEPPEVPVSVTFCGVV
jgi:hypothetical protein